MSEEVELAAKTTSEVIAALADDSGVLGPLRERFAMLTARVHYKHYPKLVQMARQAAKEIEASGLPREAFDAIPDPLLRSILEAGAIEENEELQARWASLLANALTSNGSTVARSYPRILCELEPVEVRLLATLFEDRPSDKDSTRLPGPFRAARGSRSHPGVLHSPVLGHGLTEANLDNIERLGLMRYEEEAVPTPDHLNTIISASRSGFRLTPLGIAFVEACQAPVSRV